MEHILKTWLCLWVRGDWASKKIVARQFNHASALFKILLIPKTQNVNFICIFSQELANIQRGCF